MNNKIKKLQKDFGRRYWQYQANKPSWYDTIDPPINGGVLSEVIVFPTDDQNWLFSQGRYKHNSRKPLADASTRKMVANYLSQYENENAQSYNDRIKRLADIIYETNGVIFKANEVKEGKLKNRAHYNPKEEIGYVTTMPDLLAELSHPYQEWFGNNKDQDEYNMSNYDSDSDPRGGTRYAYPDTYEGETHGFFEPALTEWVETGKISRSLPFLNEDKAKEKITPKDWHEVVDSAKSWNQQAIDKRILPMPSQLSPWSRIKYSITDFPLLEKKSLQNNSIKAANARKWKHKKGGKAFITGVNILDSNPKAYKYVKKKYKMAQQGTKLNFFQKAGNFLNSDLGKTISNGLVNAFSSWTSSNKQNNAIDSQIEALKKQNKADINSIQNQALQKATGEITQKFNEQQQLFNSGASFEQPSPIVFEHLKSQLANKYAQQAINDANLNSQEAIANLESQKTNPTSDVFSSLVNTGFDYLSNKFANKALDKNGVPSSRNASFYSNPYLKTQNKVGTINSDGSMNTGIGGTTYNWKTNTFGSNNMMNSFDKIKF